MDLANLFCISAIGMLVHSLIVQLYYQLAHLGSIDTDKENCKYVTVPEKRDLVAQN